MNSIEQGLMQNALGADWQQLPPALQAHYAAKKNRDTGVLDIEYPRFMQPVLSALHLVGALLDRRGTQLATTVDKERIGGRQYWRRAIAFPDGRTVRFNSFWIAAGGNELIEFVNPVLGLQMAVSVDDGKLHYQGIRFVVKLGALLLPIPEWLALGHTTIVEEALDERHFAMDFRLVHPLFGPIFRYAGRFETHFADTSVDDEESQS